MTKTFGTNAGSIVNAKSSHCFESPTARTNPVQMVLILPRGAGLTNTFGNMLGISLWAGRASA